MPYILYNKNLPICLKLFEIIIRIKAVRLGRYVTTDGNRWYFAKLNKKSRRDGHKNVHSYGILKWNKLFY